jgi:hypothetical protein
MKNTYLSLLTPICDTSMKPFHYCELFVLQLPMSAVVPSSGDHYATQGCTNISFKFLHLAFRSRGCLLRVIVDPFPLCLIGGSRSASGISRMCAFLQKRGECNHEHDDINNSATFTASEKSSAANRKIMWRESKSSI